MKMTKKKPKIKQWNDYQQFHLFVNRIGENVHGTNLMHTELNEKRKRMIANNNEERRLKCN